MKCEATESVNTEHWLALKSKRIHVSFYWKKMPPELFKILLKSYIFKKYFLGETLGISLKKYKQLKIIGCN